jgi:hypothetical protein
MVDLNSFEQGGECVLPSPKCVVSNQGLIFGSRNFFSNLSKYVGNVLKFIPDLFRRC